MFTINDSHDSQVDAILDGVRAKLFSVVKPRHTDTGDQPGFPTGRVSEGNEVCPLPEELGNDVAQVLDATLEKFEHLLRSGEWTAMMGKNSEVWEEKIECM